MAEVLWSLFLIGVGLLWAWLVYVSWGSSGFGDLDRLRPVWVVLLRGGRGRDEAAHARTSEYRPEEGGS